MTDHGFQALTGPEFLEHVANAEEALGNDVNAHEYRQRAKQWKTDLADLDALRGLDPPTFPLRGVPGIRPASQLPTHHITPSDHRA